MSLIDRDTCHTGSLFYQISLNREKHKNTYHMGPICEYQRKRVLTGGSVEREVPGGTGWYQTVGVTGRCWIYQPEVLYWEIPWTPGEKNLS